MDSNSQQAAGGPPVKPWEQADTSSGPTPFKPPSSGRTSDVVEASGTARPGEIVSTADRNTAVNRNALTRPVPTRPWEQQQNYGSTYGGYNSGLNYNSGYGSGMYGSSYGGLGGGLGGSYGGGLYGNNMYSGGYGGLYGGSSMYGGGMYNGGLGAPMGGYGMGMGPYGEQDPNNPYGGPPSPPGFWISFLRVMQGVVNFFGRVSILIDQNTQAFHMFMSALLQLFDRSGMLYGELARFVLRLLGIKTKPRQVNQPGPNGLPGPHNPHGNQNYLEGPKAAPSGAWDNVWGDNAGEMGASSSTQRHVSPEQSEVESLAASRGALPLLQNAFSKLAHPQTKALPLQSLQQCFSLNYENLICEAPPVADSFKGLLDHLGPSIADLFFVPEKGGLSWVEFVIGYVKCCGRMPASMLLNTLLRVFATTFDRAGRTLKLEFESGDADCKISGFLLPIDVLMIFWMFWTMWWDARTRKFSKGKDDFCLPDVNHLVLSAVVSCAEVGSDFNSWDCNISELEVQLPVDNFLTWTLTTVPSLADCFTEFVNARLQSSVASESPADISTSSSGEISSTKAQDTHLLSPGRAWTISLTLRNSINEELLKLCCPIDGEEAEENLLYRSSLHGRGLNRFWSNIEGYHGPLLILLAASSGDASERETSARKWIIGALTQQGFENKDVFYGSSGNLYAISPNFHSFLPSGKEKNFVYSHIHPTGRVYEAHPKPLGIAFGGTIGNERIFIDEDFSRVTVRHHAIDKTYQHGSLIPHQGFLPVESLISEVEVWGVGGRSMKQMQMSYKKREELFTEQRRKVDLKKFASWEDSPEKMMMSNPNAIRREDRSLVFN